MWVYDEVWKCAHFLFTMINNQTNMSIFNTFPLSLRHDQPIMCNVRALKITWTYAVYSGIHRHFGGKVLKSSLDSFITILSHVFLINSFYLSNSTTWSFNQEITWFNLTCKTRSFDTVYVALINESRLPITVIEAISGHYHCKRFIVKHFYTIIVNMDHKAVWTFLKGTL